MAKTKPVVHAEVPNPSNFCYLITVGVLSSAEGSSIPKDCKIALSHSCTFLTILLAEHGYSFLHNSNPHEVTHTICQQHQCNHCTPWGMLLQSHIHTTITQRGLQKKAQRMGFTPLNSRPLQCQHPHSSEPCFRSIML